jgi:hypothetical protein
MRYGSESRFSRNSFGGATAIATIPKDIFPSINIPVVTVIWRYSGNALEEMDQRESLNCALLYLLKIDGESPFCTLQGRARGRYESPLLFSPSAREPATR